MSSALVVYGTKSGCTAEIAETIGGALRAAGVATEVVPAEDKPDASAYDAVIVGSGVRAGLWHAHVKQWFVGHAEALKQRPVALFTVGLTIATNPERADTVRGYTDLLLSETGVEPVDIGLFPGMNVPEHFSRPERFVMRAMKAPEGDFRDDKAVAAWAADVASKLHLTN